MKKRPRFTAEQAGVRSCFARLEVGALSSSQAKSPVRSRPQRVPAGRRVPSETAECRAFVEWTKLVQFRGRPLFDRLVKIPNERGKRGVSTAILASIGMRAGFPDYLLLAPAGKFAGLLLEAKKVDDFTVPPAQETWRDDLIEFGYHAEICAGAENLIYATQQYFVRTGCEADGSYINRTRV